MFPRCLHRGSIEAYFPQNFGYVQLLRFRGAFTAAPLKRIHSTTAKHCKNGFRGAFTAAPLKQLEPGEYVLGTGPFPRCLHRGSIEALGDGPLMWSTRGVSAVPSPRLH